MNFSLFIKHTYCFYIVFLFRKDFVTTICPKNSSLISALSNKVRPNGDMHNVLFGCRLLLNSAIYIPNGPYIADRSFKDKRSSYAPETGVRYDGIYRVEKCWLKPGIQVRS